VTTVSSARFVGRRLLASIPVLIGISIAVFLLLQLAPGSPEQTIAGRNASPEQLAEVRAAFGLDDSLPVQYLHFAEGAVHLDLGSSYISHQSVGSSIGEGLKVSVPLIGISFVLITIIGVLFGTLAAYRLGGGVDRSLIGASVVAASMPPFIIGILLLSLFAVQLELLPASGEGGDLVSSLEHLILPIVTLTLGGVAAVLQITRTRVKEVRREDYMTFAEARGLSRWHVLTDVVLRNTGIQIITQCGNVLIGITVGAVLVEETFALNGVGTLLIHAIETRDLPVVQGVTVMLAAFVLATNLVVDFLYFVLDPRVQGRQVEAGGAV
jgi:peptide/nickel transport system permease protein